MPLFIKNSIIYRLFDKFILNPYDNSVLKKNLGKVVNCFKQSAIYKNIERYLDKKPYFLNSLSYKFIRKIVKLLDKLMDFLNKTIKKWLLGSSSFFETRSIKYSSKEKNLLLLSILIGSFNVFYTLAGIILNTVNLYVSYGILAITLILFLFSKNTDCFKQSFIYKIFKSW